MRRQHLGKWSEKAIALMATFQPLAQRALQSPTPDPVVLDELAHKAAQIAQHMATLQERAHEYAATVLDEQDG